MEIIKKIIQGDCVEELKKVEAETIDLDVRYKLF